MPTYPHNPTGVPTGLPERLAERKTRVQPTAARAVEGFGSRIPCVAEACPEPEMVQWLIAQLPCGHTTRVSARVKGRHLESGRNQAVLLGRAASGANS